MVLDLGVDSTAANRGDVMARELLHGRRALVVADESHGSVLTEQLAWWGVRSEPRGQRGRGAPAARRRRVRRGAGRRAPTWARWARQSPVVELTAPHLAGDLRVALLQLLGGDAGADPVIKARVEQPGKGRILVVEDNPVNQMVATGLLAALGYTTDTADDGLAAIEAAGDGGFDAILMDVQMPHMDGYTATRHIRAHETGRRRPIIAMTAAAVAGERERCLEAGMDDFLTKPVDAARLADTLNGWLAPGPSVRRPAGPRPARGSSAGSTTPTTRAVVREPGDRRTSSAAPRDISPR